MTMRTITSFVDGAWRPASGAVVEVKDKFSGDPIALLRPSSDDDVDHAVRAAQRVAAGAAIPLIDRIDILRRVADAIGERAREFADVITDEAGSTIAEARKEVERAIVMLRVTAEEARRIDGEIVPLEGEPGGAGKFAFMLRHPVGIVCAITAFNSPLNTPIHKIAPALAAGNAVIVKPPTQTPICSAMLCDLFAEAGLPAGWLNYIAGTGSTVGEQLLSDERISFYHFTGSTVVGKHIASRIGLRRSSLELGSIAATIICADSDLDLAIKDVARAGYAKAGQVCTSTQLVLVEQEAYDAVRVGLQKAVSKLRYGNPKREDTHVGPLISPAEADRVCGWMEEAVASGAEQLVGGARERSVVAPALFVDVPSEAKLTRQEIFGPVVTLASVATLGQAVQIFNGSPYGLAAGVFTRDVGRAFHAIRCLRAGTIHLNASSSSRLDAMPFGGVKDSGHGKEGPKYAIEEMTERRLAVWHGV